MWSCSWCTPGRSPTQKPARKSGASSALARRRRMRGELMKKGRSDRLTPAQQAEIDALAALPDDQIDTRHMPEVRDWSGAVYFFGLSSSSSHCGSTPM